MMFTAAAVLLAAAPLICLRGTDVVVNAVSCDPGVVEMSVTSTAEAEGLVDALQCEGTGQFVVDWQGEVILSQTISVSNGSALNISGSSDAVIDGGGVVRLFKIGSNATLFLDTVTLTRGWAWLGYGGALYVLGSSKAVVVNCIFISNNASYSGGAVTADSSNFVVLEKNEFINNTSGWSGGAIAVLYSTALTIQGETYFTSNYAAGSGGAISTFNYKVRVQLGGRIHFEANVAGGRGGAISNGYGQVNLDGIATFIGNNAIEEGGAVSLLGGAFTVDGNTTWSNNNATSGGAIHLWEGAAFNCTGSASFTNNTAEAGGALATADRSDFAFNCSTSFVGNEALEDGGAAYIGIHGGLVFSKRANFLNNGAGRDGGAIYLVIGSLLIDGETTVFERNYAVTGGGAIFFAQQSNGILRGHQQFIFNAATSGGAVSMTSSDVNMNGLVSFVGNQATTNGGAVSMTSSDVNMNGLVSFVGNQATTNGGGIYASDSSLAIKPATQFESNVAMTGSGGGVYTTKTSVEINEATFSANRAVWGGGLAHFSSGSVWNEDDPNSGPANITGCTFDGNEADDGGAIYSAASYDIVENSTFVRNFAEVSGGALLHSGVLVALNGSTFEGNRAGEDGLAVMSLGLAEQIKDVTFTNNTLYCNTGEYGYEESSDAEEVSGTCRFTVVCSRCVSSCEDIPVSTSLNEAFVPLCKAVPNGVNTTGSSGSTVATLRLMQGYYRTSNQSQHILECYKKEACIGGTDASNYCAEGYQGPYCAVCQGDYASGFQYSCRSCKGSDKWLAVSLAIVALCLVLIVVALVVADLIRVIDGSTNDQGMWERRASRLRDGLVNTLPLTAIKTLVVTWQIITQFSAVVVVDYPAAYENFLAVLNLVNLDLGFMLSFSCIVETGFYAQLVLATIGPLVVLAVLAATYTIARRRNGHSIDAMSAVENKHFSIALFILLMIYSSVSYTIFQTFVCDTLDDGVRYLRADYSLECSTKSHSAYMVFAGFMALVYPIGVPAAFTWWLVINRHSLKLIVRNGDPQVGTIEPIKDLWAPYKPNRYYYEVIECGRRVALTGLAVFIYPGAAAQVAIEALFAVIFYAVFEMQSPFVSSLDTWLYRSGSWVVYLSMYLALLLKVDTTQDDHSSQNVFAGLLIAAHIGMVIVVIVQSLLSGIKGFQEITVVELDIPRCNQRPSTIGPHVDSNQSPDN